MKKLRQSGGYRMLASFQTTTIIYDATVWFCEKFLDPKSRTIDQMVQAARSGLEELLLDFEDFLRHRRLQLWDLYADWLEHDNPEIRANAIICLIHQANYLLDQQVARLEQDFIENGGYRAQLSAARFEHRTQQSDADSPKCPNCSGIMSIKTARSGRNAGSQFWGCDQYPTCRGVVPISLIDDQQHQVLVAVRP